MSFRKVFAKFFPQSFPTSFRIVFAQFMQSFRKFHKISAQQVEPQPQISGEPLLEFKNQFRNSRRINAGIDANHAHNQELQRRKINPEYAANALKCLKIKPEDGETLLSTWKIHPKCVGKPWPFESLRNSLIDSLAPLQGMSLCRSTQRTSWQRCQRRLGHLPIAPGNVCPGTKLKIFLRHLHYRHGRCLSGGKGALACPWRQREHGSLASRLTLQSAR